MVSWTMHIASTESRIRSTVNLRNEDTSLLSVSKRFCPSNQMSLLTEIIYTDFYFWYRKKGYFGANAMKRVDAGAHFPTPWVFEPAKCPDDRADYCLCRPGKMSQISVLMFFVQALPTSLTRGRYSIDWRLWSWKCTCWHDPHSRPTPPSLSL